ncbi:MAG: response regulator [Anaerolineales bacterium]|nr:response regulator [Anaerolineales bacterium]
MSGVALKSTRIGQLRIVVADDIQATCHSTKLMLNLLPNTQVVATAANGYEAIQLVHEHQPDLLIMDINMPKMDGVSALSKLRQDFPSLNCLLISSERDEVTLSRARKAGAFDFLVKPFTSEELIEVISRLWKSLEERPELPQTGQLRDRRDVHLVQLAAKYAKARRTDDEALSVFEELAENPYCDDYWLKSLAMMYVIRMKWGKLESLAARLAEQS